MRGLEDVERLLRRTYIARPQIQAALDGLTAETQAVRARQVRIDACEARLLEALERADAPPVCHTLADLKRYLADTEQYEQLESVNKVSERSESLQLYLCNYETNTDTSARKRHLQGTFTVLGTLKRGQRETYEVKLYKQSGNDKGSFFCSCPDHKFHSKKRCCKHIAWIVCRVVKLLDPGFFETRRLTDAQFEAVKAKAENTQQLLGDLTLCRPPACADARAMFTLRTKPLTEEDVCPICYDALEDTSEMLSCPSCTNYVHGACMTVWLERHPTCVYCRSDVWKHYKP